METVIGAILYSGWVLPGSYDAISNVGKVVIETKYVSLDATYYSLHHIMLVVMPEMNGRELSEKLQKAYPALKVLFVSGYTADVIAHRGILDDGVCFVSKPFSKKTMAVKIIYKTCGW